MKYGGIRTPLVPRPSTGISCSFAGVLSAEIVYKAAIEVGETKEHTNVVHGLGYWPGGDSGDLRGVHLDTLGANDKPEEGDFLYMELAFAQFQDQVGLPEPFQN